VVGVDVGQGHVVIVVGVVGVHEVVEVIVPSTKTGSS
jgi:hypothetical protein